MCISVLVMLLSAMLLPLSVSGQTPITMWLYAASQSVTDWAKSFEEQFNKDNPDIKLEIVTSGSRGNAAREQLLVATVAGVGPDIWSDSTNLTGTHYINNITVPIDQYFSQMDGAADFLPDVLEYVRINGHLHGLPVQMYPFFEVYNLELFEKSAVSLPNNWEQLLSAVRKLTRVEGTKVTQFGYTLNTRTTIHFGQYLLDYTTAIGPPFMDAVSPEINLNTPINRMAFTHMKELFDAGMQGVPSSTWKSAFGNQAAIQAAVTSRELLNDMPNYSVALKPVLGPQVGQEAIRTNGHTLYLTTNSKEPEKAWRVMEAFAQPDNMTQYALLTGVYPVRRSTLVRPEVLAGPYARELIGLFQYKSANSAVNPYFNEVREAIGMELHRGITGELSVHTALAEAERVAKAILADKVKN
ncbi:MAG TPA: extracellular solute-binding protein [Firmicutes bacterium]|nr:extracellular solute-binding protein [Bacillota bacterium]